MGGRLIDASSTPAILEAPVARASESRRVLVVGGGPAGMEAARVAALRGHRVELVEAGDRLGGRLVLAAATDDGCAALLARLEDELGRLGIGVRLGVAAAVDEIVDAGFDDVLLATGAVWSRPAWGADDARVSTIDELADWLRFEGDETGVHIVVVGGDRIADGLARVARRRGASVELIEESGRVLGLDGGGLHFLDARGRAREARADLVFHACPTRLGSTLAAALRPRGVVGRMIGDAQAIRLADGALASAAEAATSL